MTTKVDTSDPSITSAGMSHALLPTMLEKDANAITALVQEQVHDVLAKPEATRAFANQVIGELETVMEQYCSANSSEMNEQQEAQIGALLHAAAMTIRYTTERSALLPLIPRYWKAFHAIMHLASEENEAVNRLKMTGASASVRILESFEETIFLDDVEKDLQFFISCISTPGRKDRSYLVQPLCDYTTVVLQTHVDIASFVYSHVLPSLLCFIRFHTTDSESSSKVASAAVSEAASTSAVLIQAKLQPRASDVMSILPLPAFANQFEDEEVSTIAQLPNESSRGLETPSSLESCDREDVVGCIQVVLTWLEDKSQRSVAASALPALCHAAFAINGSYNAAEDTAGRLIRCLDTMDLVQPEDFDFVRVVVDAITDLLMRMPYWTAATLQALFDELKTVVPSLEDGMKASKLDKAKRAAIRKTCQSTRDGVVEAIVAWIHAAGPTETASVHDVLVQQVVTKLADPRIYGDILYVLRDSEMKDAYASCLADCSSMILQAVNRLKSYSKASAKRIVHGVSRLAVGAGGDIAFYAEDLAQPLIDELSSLKGASKATRLQAVGCLLSSSALDNDFINEDNEWVQQIVGILLLGAGSEDITCLSIVNELLRTDETGRLTQLLASYCLHNKDSVFDGITSTLSRWPLYDEDYEIVMLLLDILRSLQTDQEIRQELLSYKIDVVVELMIERAKEDKLDDLVHSCSAFLQTS